MRTTSLDIEAVAQDIAEWVKAGRKALGKTQQEFAVILDVAIRTVQLWEGGYQLPEGENWIWLSALIGPPPLPKRVRLADFERRSNPGWLNLAIGGTPDLPAEEPALAVR